MVEDGIVLCLRRDERVRKEEREKMERVLNITKVDCPTRSVSRGCKADLDPIKY